METFKLCISKDSYETKLSRDDCKDVRFQTVEVDIEKMIQLIKKGYIYTSLMQNNWRDGENFICSRTLTFDIDDSTIDMVSYIDSISIKPSFAYTSSSNGLKGFRFRMVYVLDSDICSIDEYEILSRSFAKQLSLRFLDPRSFNGEQMWFGCNGCEVYRTDNVLKVADIERCNDLKSIKPKSASKTIIIHTQHYGLSCTFQIDFENMSFQELIEKYDGVYDNIMKSPIEYDVNTPIIHYPKDYYEIRRPWKRVNGEVLKIKDGEGRRRKLFLNGIIRRKINPNISYENLVYNLVWEFYYYYINNGNKITKKDILDIATNAMDVDVDKYDIGKPRYKSFVNPLYCELHNMTPKQVFGQSKNKKQYIGEFYDPSLTDKKNIEIMNEYGLQISLRTLKTWKKENGIKKYKK